MDAAPAVDKETAFTSLAILKASPDWPNNLKAMIEGDFGLMPALALWAELETEAAFYKEVEMDFRKACFAKAFPTPRLGVNNYKLPAEYVLKATHKLNIKVDETLLPAIRAELAAMDKSLDNFIKVKYDLNPTAYAAVVKEEEALEVKPVGSVIRKMLTFTDASPSMEIVKPKKK